MRQNTATILPARQDSPLFSVADIRQMEAQLFSQQDSFAIMQQAAQAIFAAIHLPPRSDTVVHVVLGSGNNAGDGLLLAALLQQDGQRVKAYRLFTKPFVGDAGKAYELACQRGVTIVPFTAFTCQANDRIVEAVFGIGLDRPISGLPHVAIKHINQQKQKYKTLRVYAVDIAAGIQADTGQVLGCALQADETITFIGDKIGLHTADGKAASGKVSVAALGASHPHVGSAFLYEYASPVDVGKGNAHKGDFGHVLTIGGGQGMFGAAALAAVSSLKVGVGKSSLFTHSDYQSQYHLEKTPLYEVMRCLSLDNLSMYSALVLGVGLGRTTWGKHVFEQTLKQREQQPIVIDADGLYHLANVGEPPIPHVVSPPVIITPHEAEAARLLKTDLATLCQDKPAAAKALAKQYHAIVVLKGAGTLISDGQNLWINRSGNVNLATAGSGDVLAGMIGGYLAQGVKPLDAALYAVYQQGLAADRYADRHAGKSLRAGDIWDYL